MVGISVSDRAPLGVWHFFALSGVLVHHVPTILFIGYRLIQTEPYFDYSTLFPWRNTHNSWLEIFFFRMYFFNSNHRFKKYPSMSIMSTHTMTLYAIAAFMEQYLFEWLGATFRISVSCFSTGLGLISCRLRHPLNQCWYFALKPHLHEDLWTNNQFDSPVQQTHLYGIRRIFPSRYLTERTLCACPYCTS